MEVRVQAPEKVVYKGSFYSRWWMVNRNRTTFSIVVRHNFFGLVYLADRNSQSLGPEVYAKLRSEVYT